MSALIQALKRMAPQPVRTLGRAVLRRWQGEGLPATGRGTVQDLYYWVSDGRTDTNVLLNNFYSVFFPTAQTDTRGSIIAFAADGRRLGSTEVAVGHLQCVKLTMSRLLDQWNRAAAAASGGRQSPGAAPFGSLLFNLEIPPAVLQRLAGVQGPWYFWHRFYIEYVTASSQPAFVHCVDKTLVLRERGRPLAWYRAPKPRDWAPEMPLRIGQYRRVWVILINRTRQPAPVALTVEDADDRAERFAAAIPPGGVHRFELTPALLRRLAPGDLRMRVSGLPTTWARPVLFKEFENGTISTMHC